MAKGHPGFEALLQRPRPNTESELALELRVPLRCNVQKSFEDWKIANCYEDPENHKLGEIDASKHLDGYYAKLSRAKASISRSEAYLKTLGHSSFFQSRDRISEIEAFKNLLGEMDTDFMNKRAHRSEEELSGTGDRETKKPAGISFKEMKIEILNNDPDMFSDGLTGEEEAHVAYRFLKLIAQELRSGRQRGLTDTQKLIQRVSRYADRNCPGDNTTIDNLAIALAEGKTLWSIEFPVLDQLSVPGLAPLDIGFQAVENTLVSEVKCQPSGRSDNKIEDNKIHNSDLHRHKSSDIEQQKLLDQVKVPPSGQSDHETEETVLHNQGNVGFSHTDAFSISNKRRQSPVVILSTEEVVKDILSETENSHVRGKTASLKNGVEIHRCLSTKKNDSSLEQLEEPMENFAMWLQVDPLPLSEAARANCAYHLLGTIVKEQELGPHSDLDDTQELILRISQYSELHEGGDNSTIDELAIRLAKGQKVWIIRNPDFARLSVMELGVSQNEITPENPLVSGLPELPELPEMISPLGWMEERLLEEGDKNKLLVSMSKIEERNQLFLGTVAIRCKTEFLKEINQPVASMKVEQQLFFKKLMDAQNLLVNIDHPQADNKKSVAKSLKDIGFVETVNSLSNSMKAHILISIDQDAMNQGLLSHSAYTVSSDTHGRLFKALEDIKILQQKLGFNLDDKEEEIIKLYAEDFDSLVTLLRSLGGDTEMLLNLDLLEKLSINLVLEPQIKDMIHRELNLGNWGVVEMHTMLTRARNLLNKNPHNLKKIQIQACRYTGNTDVDHKEVKFPSDINQKTQVQSLKKNEKENGSAERMKFFDDKNIKLHITQNSELINIENASCEAFIRQLSNQMSILSPRLFEMAWQQMLYHFDSIKQSKSVKMTKKPINVHGKFKVQCEELTKHLTVYESAEIKKILPQRKLKEKSENLKQLEDIKQRLWQKINEDQFPEIVELRANFAARKAQQLEDEGIFLDTHCATSRSLDTIPLVEERLSQHLSQKLEYIAPDKAELSKGILRVPGIERKLSRKSGELFSRLYHSQKIKIGS